MENGRKAKPSGLHYKSSSMIGNTREGQGYADKRKRKILSRYKKLIHKTRNAELKSSGPEQQIMISSLGADSKNTRPKPEGKHKQTTTHYKKSEQRHKTTSIYTKDKCEFDRRGDPKQSNRNNKVLNRYTKTEKLRQKETEEHQRKLQEKNARRQSREEALRKYREKKETIHKKLSKRTPRGQPIIKYQMDYLLEKYNPKMPEYIKCF